MAEGYREKCVVEGHRKKCVVAGRRNVGTAVVEGSKDEMFQWHTVECLEACKTR